MNSALPSKRDSALDRLECTLDTALDPNATRGRRAQRLLDAGCALGAVEAALADALEEWNRTHLDALLRLPTELVNSIFRLLNFRSRIAVSGVSRAWRTAALADPFLWNVARFSRSRRGSLVYYPPAGRPNKKSPPRPAPPKKEDILRELLARSDPVPFALTWKNERPTLMPDEVVNVMLQNMHRMHELTVDLHEHVFQRLFALPAPMLRVLSSATHTAECILPARWDAPVLRKLELYDAYVPVGMEPLRSVERFLCHSVRGLTNSLFALFPALTSLHIEDTTHEVVQCLGNPPPTLVELRLQTESSVPIDYASLLAACRACRLRRLLLESARDLAPALELFKSAVAGPWSMKIVDEGSQIDLVAEGELVRFEIHLAAARC